MNNIGKVTEKVLMYNLIENFNSEVEDIKELILDGYDGLAVKVNVINSKSNPILFRDGFVDSLNRFVFVEQDNHTCSLHIPTIETFDFSGIEIIEQVLEGTIGTYVEISHEDLVRMTGKTTINDKPINPDAPKVKRVYLKKYNDWVRQKERSVLNKKLIVFPFSNIPSLDAEVFGAADDYVTEHIEGWINKNINSSLKNIESYSKGAIT